MSAETPTAPKRVNLRTPDVMAAVQAQVETHYRSEVVERVRANGGVLEHIPRDGGGLIARWTLAAGVPHHSGGSDA